MTTTTDTLRLLRERAAELARRRVETDESPRIELLLVSVAGRPLAFHSRTVRQIVRNERLCRLPQGSGAMIALVAAQGAAVPVADLASLLDGTPPDAGRPLIALLDGPEPVGVLVDEASSVLSVHAEEIRPRPDRPSDTAETGITADGVVVLDTAILLDDPRLHPAPTQASTIDDPPAHHALPATAALSGES